MANPKILIIDDDPDISEGMRVVLESRNYQVQCAHNGEDGMQKASQFHPDLIILDVMMESVDKGFEVARRLKNDKDHSAIPILMLTAIKEKMGLGFENEAGDKEWLPVDAYCDKPLNPQELILKVEALLK